MRRLNQKQAYVWIFLLPAIVAGLFAVPQVLYGLETTQSGGPPDQIHLAWVDDPATTMTVVWHTAELSTPSEIQYRPNGQTGWITVAGAQRPSGTDGTLHEVNLTGLNSDTPYDYRVRGDSSTWSTIYTFRTAPAIGPAAFDAVYVADTGLVGRTDGLATGTQQVVDEIVALQPDVLLPGGDYAYYNTEGDRFPTLNGAIDAWFNQMQPAAAQTPMMPTYGNHEVLLGENVEDWLARFPTPNGYSGRRFYSFDIADVHFISIYAPHHITDTVALDWIEQDIIAAQTAGQKWIIPYFHVAPFADGENHSSNQSLRNKLGPIFEAHNIPLVIASHDQAYERTWPLTNAATTADPTTTTHRACVPDAEGTTWIKVSPGGKLSNISWGFSPWISNPAPAWTSVRSHSLHQFARLRFQNNGALLVEIWGIIGDGSTPVLIDTFTLAESCPAELLISEPDHDFALFDDEAAEFDVQVTHSLNALEPFTVISGAPWLVPVTTSGVTTGTISFNVNPAGLAPGTYAANVIFNPASGSVAGGRLLVTLNVRGNTAQYEIVHAVGGLRSTATPLHDASIYGSLFAYTTPDTADIGQVRFLVDDQKSRREKGAPYDLAGTVEGQPVLFDTASLPNGEHVVTAVIVKQDGSVEHAAARFSSFNQPLSVILKGVNSEEEKEGVPLSMFVVLVVLTGMIVFTRLNSFYDD